MRRGRLLGACALFAATALSAVSCGSPDATKAAPSGPASAYGVQYDASHVYVEHGKLNDFIASWLGTFGGTSNAPTPFGITPTPSKALASIIHSPVGLLAAYDYQTPVPYPFGPEQTGFGVHGTDQAAQVAHQAGASVLVAPWTGPVGREAVIEFPGGFRSQIYEQTDMSGFIPVTSQPEFRVYLPADTVSAFVSSYLAFTGGKVVSDDATADGGEIGAPGTVYHRIRISTPFGNTVVSANQGNWNYPYGRDTTGYTVPDVNDTITKGKAHGAVVLAGPYRSADRTSAVLQFPGGLHRRDT